MIIDKLKQWECYPFGSAWKLAFEFLLSLPPDMKDKRYDIQGDDIYAQISSYKTHTPEAISPETHQQYIDIQTILSGVERIDTSSKEGLILKTPYDTASDVAFYNYSNGLARIKMIPGTFALFFPHDAHAPGLQYGENPENVKKVVVKMKVDLLNPTAQ